MNALSLTGVFWALAACSSQFMISVSLTQGFRTVNAENRPELELVVQQLGEAVLATITTVDRLSERVDTLTHQVQQQGYQIFALSDAVQTLTEAQQESLKRLDRLTDVLDHLVKAVDPTEPPPS